ncbi:MAG: chemotaxis protein CheW [Deltaproteobacteria bacterium]|nr:chemotaxis protein CheW [Deltaproteobacteria bacterium]
MKPGSEREAPEVVAAPVSAEVIVQLCAFVVGGEEYAVDIMRIKEIIPPSRITPVPHAPEFIEGVINLRGAIIPVIDLRRRLSMPLQAPTKKSKYVICTVGGRRVGLVVDAVTEVLRIPRSAIRRAPAMLTRSGPRFFLGVCGPPERLKLLLNVKALLESDEAVPGAEVRARAREQAPRGGEHGGP